MTRSRVLSRVLILAMGLLLMAGNEGCAHRRQSYSGSDLGLREGVHVRAPFVDVQVNRKPKPDEPRLSRQHDDDDDDDND